MKLAYDCRYIGRSGLGRVCKGFLDSLDFQANEIYLIGKKELLESYTGAHIIEDETDPYSTKGLLSFNKKLNKICDALIVPNFLIPFGVQIPVYSVMHDLIFLDIKETTNGLIDRTVKKYMLKRCVKKSEKVFCVSGFTFNRCKYHYKKYADKFCVNYEGFTIDAGENIAAGIKKEKNLVFVGNVKPHKGLKTLVEAYKLLPAGEYRLKIIGEKDNFLTGMNVEELLCEGVEFTGRLSDEELFREVAKASFLIQPSFYEGFGIPPLEALWLGTKPIVSDIEVFKEVYEGLDVEFFKVGDAKDLAKKILNGNPTVKTDASEILKKYNYRNMAEKIIEEIR